LSRFYDITIGATDANAGATFTNRVNGKFDPGAPQVEMDIQVVQLHTPVGNSFVRIWGVSLQQISQASDFNGASITVQGGMQKGLPLATAQAAQAGVLCTGKILMAYGNWQGVNQSLDLIIITDGGATQNAPANIVLNWKKGQTLSDALQECLSTAYPSYTLNINISDKLVLPADEVGAYQTLEQLTAYLNALSLKFFNQNSPGSYHGVTMTVVQTTINVFDGSNATGDAVSLEARDFIGQPTWLGPNQISWSMVMRGDLGVGSDILFPQVLNLQAQTSPQSQSLARTKTSFQGTWNIVYQRHVGNSRGPGADDWITNFQAITLNADVSAGAATAL